MNCPWCGFEGSARALHVHLEAQHSDAVRTEEQQGKYFYSVTCPQCAQGYRHVVKKGGRSPDFLQEFDREIRMVALDMLVHHLVAEHGTSETGT